MEEEKEKPSFINSAALGGLYMGVVLSAGAVLCYLFEDATLWINNISIFIAYVGVAYFIGKRYVAEHGDERVGYGKSLGFILVMICFAAIINGATSYIMASEIAPEYYREQYFQGLQNNPIYENVSKEMIDETYNMYLDSPLYAIFSSMFGMVIFGILPALIIASAIKTKK